MNPKINFTISKLDWLGAVLSGGCAVHCLLTPMLLPALVLLNLNFIATESFEFWSWTVTFGLCLLATLYQFVFKHKHGSVFIPLVIGFALMMNKGIFGAQAQPYVALIVGLLLVLTHMLNLAMCKLCLKCKSTNR